MIFTTYFGNKQIKGKQFSSMARGCPKTAFNHYKILAPSPELFERSKTLEYKEFEKLQLKEYEEKKEEILQLVEQLNKQNAILCCYCEDNEDCHRNVFKKFIKKHIPEIQILEIK